jgi:hypothetical protein
LCKAGCNRLSNDNARLPPGEANFGNSQQRSARRGRVEETRGMKMADRTKCRNGHDFTPENTRIYRGARICRACTRANTKKARPTWAHGGTKPKSLCRCGDRKSEHLDGSRFCRMCPCSRYRWKFGADSNEKWLSEMIRKTNHIAPFVAGGPLMKSLRYKDAIRVIRGYNLARQYPGEIKHLLLLNGPLLSRCARNGAIPKEPMSASFLRFIRRPR